MWKDIIGYENHYQVNELGQVRTLKDSSVCKNGTILKPQINKKNGYVYQMLYNNGKQKLFRLHRIVAEAFIPNPNRLPQVNHINGNKKDNRVENLEWCTQQQNMLHAFKIGLEKPSDKQKRAVAQTNKAKRKAVILKVGNSIKIFESISKASEETGVSIATISRHCRDLRANNSCYKWRFIKPIEEE